MNIKNIAIIAHVDHGKTTIVDGILQYAGAKKEGSMDSNSLEQERGITIYAKNASFIYKDTKINIIDTPGHSDFGSEVERVLRAIDNVVLIVDAAEGPMPQTRFVLKKSLELGYRPLVVINKLDKPTADPKKVIDEVLELFMELGANDEQMDFTVVYAIGRDMKSKKNLEDDFSDFTPLLDTILEHTDTATNNETKLSGQVFNLGYDNYVGRLGLLRIRSGELKSGQNIFVKNALHGNVSKGQIVKLFNFEGVNRVTADVVTKDDVCMIAGIPNITIGDTILESEEQNPLPAITVDEPTITLKFVVNDSPFAGRDGKYVTSRQIRDRLEKELEINVGLQVDFDTEEGYKVSGRGELHISILVENMRREGFELQVSQPEVIFKEIDGQKQEPFEECVVEVPTVSSGVVIEKLGKRKGIMTDMKEHMSTTRMIFEIPTRGLLGYRNEFVVDTKGEGILSSRFLEFKPYAGSIERRAVGSMISMENGKALTFSLFNLQSRGEMYIGPSAEVYVGMIVGNTSKGEEMEVNPTKGKQLTNMRASGTDDAMHLVPAKEITVERGLEIMEGDEYLEITPNFVRLRKKFLTKSDRDKNKKGK